MKYRNLVILTIFPWQSKTLQNDFIFKGFLMNQTLDYPQEESSDKFAHRQQIKVNKI
jgi:hypothetical protein